ncbi:hypothetical protein Hdeb2414_s0008g00275771 [Helianthus debilis subsp. tardiflorus]
MHTIRSKLLYNSLLVSFRSRFFRCDEITTSRKVGEEDKDGCLHVGRPKKKRKMYVDEVHKSFVMTCKMTRKGQIIKCTKCSNKGHNHKSYKGQGGVAQPAQPVSQNST